MINPSAERQKRYRERQKALGKAPNKSTSHVQNFRARKRAAQNALINLAPTTIDVMVPGCLSQLLAVGPIQFKDTTKIYHYLNEIYSNREIRYRHIVNNLLISPKIADDLYKILISSGDISYAGEKIYSFKTGGILTHYTRKQYNILSTWTKIQVQTPSNKHQLAFNNKLTRGVSDPDRLTKLTDVKKFEAYYYYKQEGRLLDTRPKRYFDAFAATIQDETGAHLCGLMTRTRNRLYGDIAKSRKVDRTTWTSNGKPIYEVDTQTSDLTNVLRGIITSNICVQNVGNFSHVNGLISKAKEEALSLYFKLISSPSHKLFLCDMISVKHDKVSGVKMMIKYWLNRRNPNVPVKNKDGYYTYPVHRKSKLEKHFEANYPKIYDAIEALKTHTWEHSGYISLAQHIEYLEACWWKHMEANCTNLTRLHDAVYTTEIEAAERAMNDYLFSAYYNNKSQQLEEGFEMHEEAMMDTSSNITPRDLEALGYKVHNVLPGRDNSGHELDEFEDCRGCFLNRKANARFCEDNGGSGYSCEYYDEEYTCGDGYEIGKKMVKDPNKIGIAPLRKLIEERNKISNRTYDRAHDKVKNDIDYEKDASETDSESFKIHSEFMKKIFLEDFVRAYRETGATSTQTHDAYGHYIRHCQKCGIEC